MAKKRKRYTAEFKAEALRAVAQRGQRTMAEVAASLGVAESVLHPWRAAQAAPGGDRGETPEAELARLRRENAELKRDRDALVKSIAVFVKDRK